jgi:DNA processing protein
VFYKGGLIVDEEADFLARLTLHHVIEPADPVFGRLQEHSEADQLLEAIKDASLPDLEPDPARRDRVADRAIGYRLRLDQVDLEASVATARTIGARYLTPGREYWPTAFDDLGPERPLGVWWLGSWLPTNGGPVAAVVGARACTGYGSYVAGTIAAALGQVGVPVASGGALGIDAAAHRGALAVGGDTIAFLACGIDLAYPRTNEMLLRAIRSHGAVVSELAPGCHPNRFRFLTRNRLIAAIGTATVVVEAAKRSGSLVTARRAGDLGRLVLAVPGPITSELSVGTHELIRDGAQVVESPQQVAAELVGSQPSRPQPTDQRRSGPAGSVPGSNDVGSSSTARSSAGAGSSGHSRSELTEPGPAGSGTGASETSESSAGNFEDSESDLGRSDLGTSAGTRPSIWSNWATADGAQAVDRAGSDPGLLSSLGPTEQIVLEALPTVRTGGMQIPELSGATGIEPGLVFAGLGRLAGLGLAAKNGSGWVLAPGQERKARRYE